MKTCRRARCNAPSDCCGAAVMVQQWPQGEPVPEGWERVDHRASHHSYYSKLIGKPVEIDAKRGG